MRSFRASAPKEMLQPCPLYHHLFRCRRMEGTNRSTRSTRTHMGAHHGHKWLCFMLSPRKRRRDPTAQRTAADLFALGGPELDVEVVLDRVAPLQL